MARLSERFRLRSPLASNVPPGDPAPIEQLSPAADGAGASAAQRDLDRQVPIGRLATEENTVTRRLYDRLGRRDVRRAWRLARKTPELEALFGEEDPSLPRMLVLHSALWHGIPGVTEKTGLRGGQPPEEIHSMTRGPLAAAGGLYEADLVGDALASSGVDLGRGGRGLDFGCSSGRVVRVLDAAFPEVAWMGCDPNQEAIAWAHRSLPGIDFFASGDRPPLTIEDASLDFAFAISVWSHFEPRLGLEWFEEMRRVLAPGALLMMTTHGLTSIAHYAGNRLRSHEQCEEIADALYRQGWWYAPEFGEEGDWGVVNPDWGTAFVSPEWLLGELCPQWRFLQFAAGRNAGNQDVYVLQRA